MFYNGCAERIMQMIDWYIVGFSALWILGLGLVVAALGFVDFLAGQQKRRFNQVLKKPVYQITINLGLTFFCLGWSGGVSVEWERFLWIVMTLIFALQVQRAMKMGNL